MTDSKQLRSDYRTGLLRIAYRHSTSSNFESSVVFFACFLRDKYGTLVIVVNMLLDILQLLPHPIIRTYRSYRKDINQIIFLFLWM
jgi:hypothetical protein